jgi:pyruvate,water dikinase
MEELKLESSTLQDDPLRLLSAIGRLTMEGGLPPGRTRSARPCARRQLPRSDEILSFVQGRATTTDLRGVVALRKMEFERYRSEPAPAWRFETGRIAYVGNAYSGPGPAPRGEGDTLRGLGCWAGFVRGPVRVARDPRAVVLAPDDMIVAERTDPGWAMIMIFPAAAGLVVERGSLLSHSAIVARELGLPTIVSLAGLTTWLKDGNWVEMDGATGVVVKLARPPKASTRVAA